MQGNPFIELASQVGAAWAWVLYGLLAINTLLILVVLLAGPRRWAQALALGTAQTDLYLVWIGMGAGAAGFLTDARMLPCLTPFLVLLAELAALLLVCRWRLHIKSFHLELRP